MDKLFQINDYQDFELVVNKIIYNLTYNTGIADETPILDFNEFKAAEDDIRRLITDNDFDFNKVGEAISVKNWDKDRVKYFLSLLDKESTKMLYASLNHHIGGYGEVVIQSDWLLKLVLGTSELNTIKYPLLQVLLSTVDSNGLQKKRLFELNKDVLRRTIETLENITEES